ncbi:MAG TPA: TonB-dependent receptor [Thermoanaerobaculia bacterium]|nr:TonB-dependent receptor [Thermoanaerobaculia bacterium]
MKSFLVFSSILVLVVPLAHAQSVSEEIVVTASALPETLVKTPATVSIVTKDDIELRAASDLGAVLRDVPGVTVALTGSAGKSATLFIRGGSSKQALVLWNGIELNDAYYSGYNVGQFSTAGVERVEVVRGPFSALYGSEAVSGVVNVLTAPSRSHATVLAEAGQHGFWNGLASGAVLSDRWTVNGALERRGDDGFASNDDYESTTAAGGVTLTPRDSLSIGLLARLTSYELGIPRAPNAAGTAFVASLQRREEGTATQVIVPVRYAGYELRLSESRREEDFADPAGTFGPERNVTESRVRTARGTARRVTRAGTITIGAEYEESLADHVSPFAIVDSRERTSRSAFVEDRISIDGGVEISAGLRLDDFDTFGSELSPRVAAAWHRHGHKLRAAYGEGFRAPGIAELYTPLYGNIDLHAERSRTVEIGYERFIGRRGLVSLTLFDSDYEDLIFFASDFTFQNIAAASSRGVELSAGNSFGAFRAGASYTFLDSKDEATGQELLRRPRHSGSVSLGYTRGAVRAQLLVMHSGRRNDVTDLLPYGTVVNEPYTTAGLAVHYSTGSWSPYVKVENVTGERYEEVFGYPSPGRRVVAGLRFGM